MSHYEERLETDLNEIQGQVKELASMVEQAVKNAVHALLTGNEELASSTILADGHINRKMRSIDTQCHSFIAVHLPSAGHLRMMSSIFRSNILLERIGDYAVTICRELFQLSASPGGAMQRGIELMAQESSAVLKQAVQAYEAGNVDLAKGTMVMAAQVQTTFSELFQGLLRESEACPLQDKFAVFVVYHRLERIADQAKNLCEETVFSVSGEPKPQKVYRILFLDEDNTCLAPMAAAIGSRAFPDSASFSSAGCQAGVSLQQNMVEFMSGRGIELATNTPKAMDYTATELADFHVIVGLQGAARESISQPPFHTVLLHWDAAEVAADADDTALEAVHRQLAVQIKDLMHELRGEDAS